MRQIYIATLCVALLFVVIALNSCTTEGIDFESGLKEFEAGNYEEAIVTFQEIVAQGGDYTNRAKFYIGESYKFQGKFDEAMAIFQEVADSEPKMSYLGTEARNRVSQIRESRRDIERLRILHSNNPGTDVAADALMELGSIYDNRLGNYDRAIEVYNQLIEEFPGSPKAAQAQVNIGNIYFYKLYDLDAGWNEFEKVNEENYPDLKFRVSEVQDLLRETNKIRGEISEHIAFIREAQKRKVPEGRNITGYERYGIKQEQVAQSFLAVATKWRQLKNYPKAIEAYRMLIDRVPLMLRQAAQARFGIAETYQLEMGQYFEALDAYNNYIKYHPTDFRRGEAIYNMAICYESLRQYENAYEYYKTYRDTYPDGKLYKAAELKVRQYEYDEDQDGYPYYEESTAGTSDTDPNAHP
ncbi:tetratricopeptide repeat protein [Candidatus Poribacteria bacterium]|nr:tetratricopeptide repeat protein [Candidatus Poribacteria bacterium]